MRKDRFRAFRMRKATFIVYLHYSSLYLNRSNTSNSNLKQRVRYVTSPRENINNCTSLVLFLFWLRYAPIHADGS